MLFAPACGSTDSGKVGGAGGSNAGGGAGGSKNGAGGSGGSTVGAGGAAGASGAAGGSSGGGTAGSTSGVGGSAGSTIGAGGATTGAGGASGGTTGASGGTTGAGGGSGGSGAVGVGGSTPAAGGSAGAATGAGGVAGAAGATGSGGAASGAGGTGTSGGTTFAVTTDRYDNARSGANLQETKLTTANVNTKQFGLVFSRTVDGQMYAQPLFVGGLTMSDKKVHDVVFVATEHNTVYAFDADDPAAAAPLWSLNVGPSGSNTCDNLSPEIGITSTPVIDPVAGTIYFISKGQEAGAWVQRIHAVNIVTGAERPGSPTVLAASVKGTGDGAVGGNIAFDLGTQLNRPGLLLVNGVVYAAFASHCDTGAYHGWILGYAYDGTKFQQVLAYNVSPNGSKGGIWQGGVGLSSDGTSIFVAAGNGSTNPSATALDLSESVFRLRISDYSVQDYWIPTAYATLSGGADADLSSGAILLPHSLLATGSKDGRLYVLDATNLGKYSAAGDQILQTLTTPGKANGAQGHVHGGPVYYAAPGGAEKVFLWPEDSPLMAYTLNATTRKLGGLVTDPIPTANFTPGHPGAVLTLSASGATAGTGILWATLPTQNGTNGAWHQTSAGALYAIDASDITKVLWSDALGTWNVAKFAPPLVANGRVYVGTFSNSLRVYGLTD